MHRQFLKETFLTLKTGKMPNLSEASFFNWLGINFAIETIRAIYHNKADKKIFSGSKFVTATMIIVVKRLENILDFNEVDPSRT